VSAARPSSPQTDVRVEDASPRDIARLRARRRAALRRRRLLRVDLGLGVFVAIVLLVATPGLAIAAIMAGLLLALCVLSVVLERRRRRAATQPELARRPPEGSASRLSGGAANTGEPIAERRRRSTR
jgi:Flp pilus assembly protein TadB